MDGDGDMDVLSASIHDDKVAWYENLMPPISIHNSKHEFPADFKLYSNYPNPFNPETTIQFDVKELVKVNLSVYDLNGRLIKKLLKDHYSHGSYRIKFKVNNLASGIYFYSMEMGNYSAVKKMIILR